jgi:hypothetical protein
VVLACLLLIPANAWWQIEIEYVRYSDNASTQALFFNAVSLLLILMGVNGILRRIRPRWMLTRHELTALYVAVAIGSNLVGHDMLQILFTTLTYVFRHAGPENGWASKILPNIPSHLVMTDPQALRALYMGNSTLYRWDHIRPWLRPLGWWTLFTMLLVWSMLCLAAIFRRQWDAERLTYPIAEIPLQLISQPQALSRSRLLWAGVTIGVTGQLVNLLHVLFPSVPASPVGIQYFSADSPPWNAAGPLPIATFPFAYGLTFLLPTQLGFSVWFFMLFSRLELVLSSVMGYRDVNPWGQFPYLQQQSVGAIFGLFMTVVWAARGHLKTVWQSAMHGDSEADEPMSYRTALFGYVAGMAGMAWFAVAAGMRPTTAVLFLGILFVIVLVVARMRAELGLPTYELYQVGADQILQKIGGTAALSHGDLTVMTLFFWLGRTHRQLPMSTQVDAIRLGKRTNTSLRSMTWLILGASALGTVAAFWAMLHSTYLVGFESAKFSGPAPGAFGGDPWNKLDNWISSPQKPDFGAMGAYAFGCLATLILAMLRARFVWWPFHPVGYLVSGSFGLFRLWLPIFVSWLAKTLILRYGGLRAYRQALPFFIGLVLGEFSMGFARTLLDLVFSLHLPAESGIGGL